MHATSMPIATFLLKARMVHFNYVTTERQRASVIACHHIHNHTTSYAPLLILEKSMSSSRKRVIFSNTCVRMTCSSAGRAILTRVAGAAYKYGICLPSSKGDRVGLMLSTIAEDMYQSYLKVEKQLSAGCDASS